MRRIDHPARPLENADVRDAVGAVAIRRPEQHVARLGVGAGEVAAHGGVVLGLGGARDGLLEGLADGELG